LCHVNRNSLLHPVGLHQSLADGNGIVLGDERGGAEGEHSGTKRETDHDTSSLDRKTSAPAGAAWVGIA
jgi:hypothetical protein